MGGLSVKEAMSLSKILKPDGLYSMALDCDAKRKAADIADVLYRAILDRLGMEDCNEKTNFFQKVFSNTGVTEYGFYEYTFGEAESFFSNVFRELGDPMRVYDLACMYNYELGVESTFYRKERDKALDEIVDSLSEYNYIRFEDEVECPDPEDFREYCDELLRAQEFLRAASCGESAEDDEFADDVVAELMDFYGLPDMDIACKMVPCFMKLLYNLSCEGNSFIFFMSKDMGEYHKWRMEHPDEKGEMVDALDRALHVLESPLYGAQNFMAEADGRYMDGWFVYSLIVFQNDVGDVFMPMLATAKAVFGALYAEFSQQISGRE